MLDAWGRTCKRLARLLATVALLAIGVVVSGAGAAHAQGLFEALFGRRVFQEAPPVVVISPGHWPDQARREHYRHRKTSQAKAHRPAAPAKPAPYVAPEVMPGPLGRFLKDPTLRPGDVVITAGGPMIFRGSGGSTHRAKDFVTVAKAAPLLSKKVRTDLAQLEVVRSTGVVLSEPAQIASAAAPIVAQDESVSVR